MTQDETERLVRAIPPRGDERRRWFDELAEVLHNDAARTRTLLRVNGVPYFAGIPLDEVYNPVSETWGYTGPDPQPTVRVGRDRDEDAVRRIVDSFHTFVNSVVDSALERERLDDTWNGRPAVTVNDHAYSDTTDALWGEFFTNIGWRAHYQPAAPGQPHGTFRVDGDAPLLVEIGLPRPANRVAELEADLPAGHTDVLLLGTDLIDPDARVDWPDTTIPAGWLGQHDCDYPDLGTCTLSFAATGWINCEPCGIAVHHPQQSFHTRPCGCYESGDNVTGPDRELLREAWADALASLRRACGVQG